MKRRFRRLTVAGGLVALLMAISTSSAFAALEAKTVEVLDVGPHSALLKGEVWLNEQTASAGFEYGKTTAYGSETDATVLTEKSGWVPVYKKITGLEPGTTYHYRFGAYVYSYLYGQDKSFTTTQPTFTAEEYPALLSGGGWETDAPTIGVENGALECASGLTGEMTGDGSSIEVTPSFENCWLNGVGSTVVAVNGCSYVFHAGAGTTGSMDIECPAGKSITASSGLCAISIPAQTGLDVVDPQVYSGNVGLLGVKFDLDVSGLEYVKTKDGFLCKFNGTGTKTDGTFTGSFGLFAETEEQIVEGELIPARDIDLGFVS